jgi:hypothetical protein
MRALLSRLAAPLAAVRWLVMGLIWGHASWWPAALAQPAQTSVLRPQTVAPLPGGLDGTLLINDNNPELIRGQGILLSTFAPLGPHPEAHLNGPLNGVFGLFSHHVYAGQPSRFDSTLWLAVVAAPRGPRPVRLELLGGATSLSQSLDPGESAAPFLPLPPLLRQGLSPVWSGPGSRVATELLARGPNPRLPQSWSLPAGQLSTLLTLPIPVRGLDPLLNGRNLQLRLRSDGPVDVALLAAYGPLDGPPPATFWQTMLTRDGLSPKEHTPTPRGSSGPIIYSRVSGIQVGATWRGRLSDPGSASLSVRRAPISWPIASLERGRLGSGQVQTAEMKLFYGGTAWAAHGNYGVEYQLQLPLLNDTPAPVTLALALESPLKRDLAEGGLRFNAGSPGAGPVVFRGTVEVAGLSPGDAALPQPNGMPAAVLGPQAFHLVQRAGERSPALGLVRLAPGESRLVRIRLVYPADATPPQVLSLLPEAPQAPGPPPSPLGQPPEAAPVKQSGVPPMAAP